MLNRSLRVMALALAAMTSCGGPRRIVDTRDDERGEAELRSRGAGSGEETVASVIGYGLHG